MITRPPDKRIIDRRPLASGRLDANGKHFQALMCHLLNSETGSPTLSVVGITSCTRGEGVSMVAAKLAEYAAESSGRDVLLITAGESPIATRVSPEETDATVSRLPCGGKKNSRTDVATTSTAKRGGLGERKDDPPAPIELAPTDIASTLTRFRSEFDFIVVDLPAVSEAESCLSLVNALDGVLLVIEAHRVPGRAVERAKRRLENAGARLVGAILNKCRQDDS